MIKSNSCLFLIILLFITSLLCCFTLTNNHSWTNDFSAYIMQAKSIVGGNPRSFIDFNRFTVQQSSVPQGPFAYPWGFPAMLAPFYAVFGLNMIALKSVGVASFLLFVLLLWFGFRKYHSDYWLVCLVCLFALNPNFIAFTDNILSDFPFLLFSTFSIIVIGKIIVEERVIISKFWDNIFLGILIAGAFFIRTNGILLLFTLVFTQIVVLSKKYRKSEGVGKNFSLNKLCLSKSISSYNPIQVGNSTARELLLIIIPFISFFCIVSVWTIILPEGGSSHLSFVRHLTPSIIKQNIIYYISLPSDFFSGTSCNNILYSISIPFCFIGLLKRYRRDYHIIVYILLTLLIYILWPAWQGLRFLFPVLPFYFSFMLTGVNSFQESMDERRSILKIFCVIPIYVIILLFGIRSMSSAYDNVINNREISTGPFSETSDSMFEFIKHNTEADSVVIFFEARTMRMMTGRNSILINRLSDLSRGDYLCLHLQMGEYGQISPNVIMKIKNVKPIYKNSDFIVYRVKDVLSPKI